MTTSALRFDVTWRTKLRRGDAEAVVGNGEGIRGTKLAVQELLDALLTRGCQRRSRLAIDAKDLLPNGVRPAC